MEKDDLLKTACIILMVCMAAIAAPAQSFTTLFSFDFTSGHNPHAGLIQATDGNFYGTTSSGGANWNNYDCVNGCGTVFKITPEGTVTTLYNFCAQTGCTDGAVPNGLIQATDGNFYGTTSSGGSAAPYSYGTVFKITPAGTLTTLYSFCAQTACTDGAYPKAGLIQATDGNFYGTTSFDGRAAPFNYGTVFKITSAGTLTTLYSFCAQTNCTDGYYPQAGLIQATDGNFYGTTSSGGVNSNNHDCVNGCGTVFKITPEGTVTTLYNFCAQTGCTDGAVPEAGLIQATDGNFYGTTSSGGVNSNNHDCVNGCGTVFKITPEGTVTTLYNFCAQTGCTDGAVPEAGLIQATDGNFYGTTILGGASQACGLGCGTVFEITSAGTLTRLHSFCLAEQQSFCINGLFPQAGLIQATDGNFYGTTSSGGANSYGTAFSLAAAPAVTLSSTSLNFGNQALNETSAAKTVTLTNSGTAMLNISGITITGNFAISANACGPTLGIHKKCVVTITFTPTALGAQSGTLSFADNVPKSPQTTTLKGTGVEPATLTPVSATYGAQAVGTTGVAKTFTLTNNQTVTLTSIVISTSGDFAVSATTCTTNLAAKSKCTINVAFAPTATGTRTGKLSVSDSANNSPQTAALTGTGVEPATLMPASVNFGTWAVGMISTAKTFTLANNQSVALTSIAISTSGDFAVSTTTCTTSLAAHSKCTINVAFAPTATGTRTGKLSVSDSANNSPQTAALTGTGVEPATLMPASVNFGTWAVGMISTAKTFTLANNQSVALTSIAISTSGDFAVSTTTCTTSLAAHSKCTINVAFAPTATGTRTGKLSVSDSANNSPQTSSLTGTGK